MPGSGKSERYHPVNSYTKENGGSNGSISVYPRIHKIADLKLPCDPACGVHVVDQSSVLSAGECFGSAELLEAGGVKRTLAFYVASVSVIINLALIIVLISLSVRPKPSPALPTCPVVTCPNGWVGYQGKCYYFAEEERNWASSKWHCSSLNAALVVVDSQEELNFLMRYKGIMDHWIGLKRNQSQPWTWVNGTVFNRWFDIPGGENCGVMNQQSIASFSCSTEKRWICSTLLVN